MGPFLGATIVPVVAIQTVLVDFLLCILVYHFDEVVSYKVITRVLFAPFTESTLLVFKPRFLCGCIFHITVLESTLIWSHPRVRRSQFILQAFWQIIELHCEVCVEELILEVLWEWISLPEDLLVGA